MQFVREFSDSSQHSIQSYGDDYVIIDEVKYQHSILVTPEKVIAWSCNRSENFNATDVELLLDLHPALILISTGTALSPIPTSFSAEILASKVGLEQMTIGAACRTLTVLWAERRNVVAGFLFD